MLIGSYGLSRHQILNTKLPALILLRKNINAQLPDDLSYQSFLSYLRVTKFISALEPAGNTTRKNIASCMIDTLLRRQLLQSYWIVNFEVRKTKRF